MARSLTGRQREQGKRKLATKRGTRPELITDDMVYRALDTGGLTYSDCTPSSGGGGSSSSYSDSGSSSSYSDSGSSSSGGGGSCD